MSIKNTLKRYGWVSILLHWTMAIIILGLIAIGLYMTRIPLSSLKLKLYMYHKEFGMLVLLLALIRLIWRLINKTPQLLSLPMWERFIARFVHWAFYAFMFILPLSGWLLSSAAGLPPVFFNLFIFPNLIEANEEVRLLITPFHKWFAYTLSVILGLHIAASLKHHFINKDDILRRMIRS